MANLLIAIILSAEITAVMSCRRQFSCASAAGVTGIYIIAAQFMAWLVLHDFISHDMLAIYGGADQDADLLRAIICAAVLFAGVWALSLPGRPADLAPSIRRSSSPAPTAAAGIICVIIWSGLLVTAATSLQWETLWSTPHYLDLTDPAVMTQSAIAALALGALPFAGATSAAVAAAIIASPRSNPVIASILIFQGALTMIWLLAAHSRAAVLAPAAFAFVIMLRPGQSGQHRRRDNWIAGASAILVVAALGGALTGRNLGDHGLASLATLPVHLADTAAWAPALATNVTEGIFAVSAGLGEWMRSSGENVRLFPDRYIWLSFSPLPSAVDGFADILHAQVRLHAYAPMPGYVELAWFGPWSQLCFVVLVAFGFRLANHATRISHFGGSGANVMLAGCLYLMAAYPVRTALKLYWLSLAISCCVILLANLRSFRPGAPPVYRQEAAP